MSKKSGAVHVTFEAKSGFEGIWFAPPDTIKANLKFNVGPSGQVSIDHDNSTITGYPSFGAYVYRGGGRGLPRTKTLFEAKEIDPSYLAKEMMSVRDRIKPR